MGRGVREVIGIRSEGRIMRILRFRLWMLMIAIAVMALLFAACAFVLQSINRGLHEFYGPGGTLDRRTWCWDKSSAGLVALRQGDFSMAEACFKAALKQVESDRDEVDVNVGWYNVPPVLVGLADALAGQHRFAEAEPLYKQALDMQERKLGPDDLHLAETLEHYCAALKQVGRTAESGDFLKRAEAIRARPPASEPSK
jgi:tetratricopeptide (TPR) repeat protein